MPHSYEEAASSESEASSSEPSSSELAYSTASSPLTLPKKLAAVHFEDLIAADVVVLFVLVDPQHQRIHSTFSSHGPAAGAFRGARHC